MMTSGPNAEPFPSIDALRHAHERLLESLPKSDRKTPAAEREISGKRIDEFIGRAIATGAILDTLANRREAQGLIDYWVASAYTRPHSRAPALESIVTAETAEAPGEGRADNQLEKFDPTVIDTAAERGAAFIDSLSEPEQDLARRIIFRLVHFPETGEEFGLATARRSELHRFGDPVVVDRLLAGLQEAGILDSQSGEGAQGDVLSLRYQALTRRWTWLNDEIKKRMNLRELALSWIGSGRSTGALLDWSLTRSFRKYSNLNDWENEFVNTSSRRVTKRLSVVGLVVLQFLFTGLFTGLFVYQAYWAPSQVVTVSRAIKNDSTPLPSKIADIKWLANFRQRIELAGLDLGGPAVKDLQEINASGAILRDSRLTAVQFDGAELSGASFDRAVIKRTSFRNALLYRANFESAELCEGVDFTGADILYASFKRARFFDETVPNFKQAAWWQTYGWGFDEIALLGQHNDKAGIKQNKKFQNEIASADARINLRQAPLEQALALNEKAWTLAIYGVADDEAVAASRRSLQLIRGREQEKLEAPKEGEPQKSKAPDDDMSSELSRNRAALSDTLAYLLMQRQESDPAAQTANTEEALALLSFAAQRGQGEVLFRYAIALHAANRDDAARVNLRRALLDLQYEPSHELYLLNRYFSGEFKQWVMEMTGRGNRVYPARCDETGR